MSFSFQTHAATKQALLEAVRARMAEVCAAQPSHNADKHHVEQAVAQKLDIMGEAREGECYHAHVNGSILCRGGINELAVITSLSLSASVYVHAEPKPANVGQQA